MAASDHDDCELQEALRRSREETTLEESMLAQALAASIATRDEELARSLQQEQLRLFEENLCSESCASNTPTTPQGGQPSASASEVLLNEAGPSSQESKRRNEEPHQEWHRKRHSKRRSSSRRTSPLSNAQSTQNKHLQPSPTLDSTTSNVHPRHNGNTSMPVVVIDGQNVGCSYGGGKNLFRAKGVQVVLDYYSGKGMKAVAMLPAHKVDTRPGIKNDRVADDPELLKNLAAQNLVSFTPSGSHDDHFLLAYAKQKNIDIISNDRFQKEVSEQASQAASRALQTFLDKHLIPYTFVDGEFMPNPNPHQLSLASHCSRGPRHRR
ncbi:putative ribonuclease ZC3H12C [Gracilariopsis chorda]|uniref:Putative ribonuclease ZC3H12C n=1 Tax=Gracilariopsis chorda TaxID=448386 RepID=A0A2V3INB0_9FLOR|nr:putative ribonuclease ZC3H12C [Gracilariopsis chorda]|eukprot:PXF43568.1 putative ribonuclease ZC3H12C [Gracilariopsis chorda]